MELQRYEHSVIQVFAIFVANDITADSLFHSCSLNQGGIFLKFEYCLFMKLWEGWDINFIKSIRKTNFKCKFL